MNRGLVKKKLAVLVSAACILSAVPTPAFASESADAAVPEAAVEESLEAEEASAGVVVSDEPAAPDQGNGMALDEAAAAAGWDEETKALYAELAGALGTVSTYGAGTSDHPVDIEWGTVYSGNVSRNESVPTNSYYQFTLDKPGRIRLDTISNKEMGWYILSAENGWDLEKQRGLLWTPAFPETYYPDNTSGMNPYAVDLIPGDYYLLLIAKDSLANTTVNYVFSMRFIELEPKSGEKLLFDNKLGGSNNEQKDAIPIELNTQYLAQQTADTYHENDWYQFTPKKKVKLYITASTQQAGHVDFSFVDGAGKIQSYFGEPPLVEMGHGIVGYPIVLKSEDYLKKMRPTTLEANKTYYIKVKVGARTSAQVQGEYTGGYRFMFSTKKPKPVKSIKISAKELQLTPGSIFRLSASVSPKAAFDTGVTWYTEDQNIAIVDYETGIVQVPEGAKAGSSTTVKVRANLPKVNYAPPSVLINKYAEETCKITIVEGEPVSANKICDPIVSKQKIDLSEEKFFGKKYDKYVVTPKDCGAVSKGVFKSTNPSEIAPGGMVTITGFTKSGKKYTAASTVSFRILAPEYKDKNKSGKPVKTYTYKEKTTVSSDHIISVNGIKADKWTLKGKASSFELDEKTGVVKILNSGSCTITAWYGKDSYAAKYTYTLKAKLPK
ncbi:MAG: Ig-like domain-containing protein [Lachnospiraceae bacterium]|nr:Ig-like domain-containing protein [Lachnospiraceae bacterium]